MTITPWFFESFAGLAATEAGVEAKWDDAVYGGGGMNISFPTGRTYADTTTGKALATSTGDYLKKVTGANAAARMLIGYALTLDAIPAFRALAYFLGDNFDSTWHVDTNGALVASRNQAGNRVELDRTAGGIIVPGQFQYIELNIEIGNSVDLVAWVNEIEVLRLEGVDTQDGTLASVEEVWLYAPTNGKIADVYFANVTTAEEHLGDVRVGIRLPNANGDSSDFVGSDSDSVDNYLLVNESGAPNDSDFVASDVIDDLDLYEIEDATGSGAIYGVQVVARARKGAAGARSMRLVSQGPTAAQEETADIAVGDSTYRDWTAAFTEKPEGGAWSVSDFNDAQFGVKAK